MLPAPPSNKDNTLRTGAGHGVISGQMQTRATDTLCAVATHCERIRRKTCAGAAGFALIVALMLMGFILILVLSLSSLVQVDVATAESERNQRQARENAMLGLQVALGQLQQHLGPDQAVSARADILEPQQSAEDEEDTTLANRNWTGVWQQNSQTPATWLTSGNEGDSALAVSPQDTPLPQWQELIRNAVQPEAHVSVPKTEIAKDGKITGSYAYWIGDEGVKAKVNIGRKALPQSAAENFALLVPQSPGVQAVSGLEWISDAADNRPHLVSFQTLEQLANTRSQPSALPLLHDLTFHSYGILSNSRDGGLKKDLSAGLRSAAITPAGSSPIFGSIATRSDFTGTAPDTAADAGGPLWGQLRSWVNATSANTPLPVGRSTDTAIAHQPVIAGVELYWLPTYDPADNFRVDLQFIPAVVLWNPYDRPLQSRDYRVRLGRSVMFGGGTGIDYITNDLILVHLNLKNASGNFARSTFRLSNMIQFLIPNVSLGPGEAKVYSYAGNAVIPATSTTNYTPQAVPVLAEGYSTGSAYALTLRRGGQPVHLFPQREGGADVLDAEGNPVPMTDYEYEVASLSRTLSLELIAIGTPNEIVASAFYINPASPATAPASGNMEAYDYSAPLPSATRNNHGWGLKIVRAWTQNAHPGSAHTMYGRARWLADFNPRASFSGPLPLNYQSGSSGYDFNNNPSNNPSYISTLENDATNIGLSANVGYTDSSGSTINRTILFESSPGLDNLFSIGQLAHAPLYRWADADRFAPVPSNWGDFFRERLRYMRSDNLIPAYAIGNSLAHPAIPTDSYYRNWGSLSAPETFFQFGGLLYDYSWLLNDALWDGYFFSAVTNTGTEAQPEYASRNPRILRLPQSADRNADYTLSAEGLMVDGAFNVNSTSVEAWKALLGSFYAEAVTLSGGASDTGTASRTAFLRTGEPHSGALEQGISNGLGASASYTGYRNLDSDQIEALAGAIVSEVKQRGPFLSMAQFVNRSIRSGDDESLRRGGALNNALAKSTVNAQLQNASANATVPPLSAYSSATDGGYSSEQLPGWLSQMDLLSRLGSVLTTRSDTFVIRSYGEVLNERSEIIARAWCEAVVQRVPEYVDSAQRPSTPVQDLNEINSQFGRRFVVTSFNWLTDDDI